MWDFDGINNVRHLNFIICLYKSTGSCCCHSDAGVGMGIDIGVSVDVVTLMPALAWALT